jgi:mitochondrial intermediate peptidase
MAREAAYKLFLYPEKQQEAILVEILNSRHELAQICGFETFAHR